MDNLWARQTFLFAVGHGKQSRYGKLLCGARHKARIEESVSMTGISDVVRSARSVKRSVLSALRPLFAHLLPAALHERLGGATEPESPLLSVPQPRLGFFQENEDAPSVNDYSGLTSPPPDAPLLWGLLLPVCCRGQNQGEACFERLKDFVNSIEETLEQVDRERLVVFVGIDQFDVFYDTDATRQRVTELFVRVGLSPDAVRWTTLRSHYRGKLCRIWDLLAKAAVDAGCSFLILVGDDVRFLTRGWKNEIEMHFQRISRETGLPFGAACVAFRDRTFPVFPTFPVIHRSHYSVFNCLLPIEFVNQHGDPFLFELYRRLGTAEFASLAALENTIGGAGDARYVKHDFQWCEEFSKCFTELAERFSF
jgi:hypothetical protein